MYMFAVQSVLSVVMISWQVESTSHAAQRGCSQLEPSSTRESSADFPQVWREGEDDSFYHPRSLACGFLCFRPLFCSEGVGASIVAVFF